MLKLPNSPYLSGELLNSFYFPRKKANQLCLVTDVKSGLVYPVPVDIEHIDLVSKLADCDIKNKPECARRIIPSNIIISLSTSEVTSIITGVSGCEIAYNVRHSTNNLNEAHNIIKKFIEGDEFKLSKGLEEKLVYQYCDS